MKTYAVHTNLLQQLPYFDAEACRWRQGDTKLQLPMGVTCLDFEMVLYRCYFGHYPQIRTRTLSRVMASIILADYLLASDFQLELNDEFVSMLGKSSDEDVWQVFSAPFVTASSVASATMERALKFRDAGSEPTMLTFFLDNLLGDLPAMSVEYRSSALSSFKSVLHARAERGWGDSDAIHVLQVLQTRVWKTLLEEVVVSQLGTKHDVRRTHNNPVYAIHPCTTKVFDVISDQITSREAFAEALKLAECVSDGSGKTAMQIVRVVIGSNAPRRLGINWTRSAKHANTVYDVAPNSVAVQAGIQAGDRLVSVNGTPISPVSCLACKNGKDNVDWERQKALLPCGQGQVVADFLRTVDTEVRHAILHRVLTVGRGLVVANIVPLEELTSVMSEGPLHDRRIAPDIESADLYYGASDVKDRVVLSF
jgi:hypothetical protein